MHAVILAGGKGIRLRPYTTALPKPLVPIGDQHAILEIVMRQLAAVGFKTVTLAVGHLGHIIQAYVGDGKQWGLYVKYAVEASPLGTLGPLLTIRDQLPEHFLVMNGDILTGLNYRSLLNRHCADGAPLTIATHLRKVDIEFGVLTTYDGRVTGFREKPSELYRVSMGVYGLSRSTLNGYPTGAPLGFDDLVLDLLKRGTAPLAYEFDGYWLDIGRPEDYDRANAEFSVHQDILLRNPATSDDPNPADNTPEPLPKVPESIERMTCQINQQ
ncbi:NDP-sugar synthase [Micromonospora sp. NPDC000089]|uniref:nucleotidyltransferase family protein n=1 Tax=unclassified Micromonospora TaxID=2617518 RepID=UPI0036B52CD6